MYEFERRSLPIKQMKSETELHYHAFPMIRQYSAYLLASIAEAQHRGPYDWY